MSNSKIKSISQLAEKSKELKSSGKSIVMCHGTFDLLHTGHIRYLQKAKKKGDVLFVTVTADCFVNKGPGRPVFNQELRAENLAALACTDYVSINHDESSVDAINRIKPNHYVKGSDYQNLYDDITGNIVREKNAVEANGGEISFTDEITFSSSELLNEYFDVFSPEVKQFLEQFEFSINEVNQQLASLLELEVLVVGDAIIDEYHYSTPLGQTGKGNVLAVRFEGEERFAGGAIAVANHISNFVKKVTLFTGIGSNDKEEEFIRSKLCANINPIFIKFDTAPTVTKRRYVADDLSKFFEIYYFNEEAMTQKTLKAACDWLKNNTKLYDAVIVPDFGNGFILPSMSSYLINESKYLAVNTQLNSGNRGFHVIQRYPRSSFVALNEPELRLAAHNKQEPIENIARQMSKNLDLEILAVTLGAKGLVLYDKKDDRIYKVPALSTKVVDRVGAGDAFLSLAGICASKGMPPKLTAFIGSVAAAIDVQIVCNREPINRVTLGKYCATLLK
jgi:rfaE bifunctional protein nucleotidyltransferase chain/domain